MNKHKDQEKAERHNQAFLIGIMLVLLIAFMANTSVALPEDKNNTKTESSKFQFAFFNPIQLVDEHKNVEGLRLNLFYGRNADVSGIDLGLGLNDSVNFKGIQIGTMNSTGLHIVPFNAPIKLPGSSAQGIQIGLFNTTNSFEGVQMALGNLDYGGITGIQAAMVLNGGIGAMKGIQISALNFAGIGEHFSNFSNPSTSFDDSGLTGIQIGLVNTAYVVTGIQIGIVNICKNLKGIQIGLINYIDQSPIPILPFINAKF